VRQSVGFSHVLKPYSDTNKLYQAAELPKPRAKSPLALVSPKRAYFFGRLSYTLWPMCRFPPPWTVEALDGAFKIVDSNGQARLDALMVFQEGTKKSPQRMALSWVDSS
jgi:hypothetical protein